MTVPLRLAGASRAQYQRNYQQAADELIAEHPEGWADTVDPDEIARLLKAKMATPAAVVEHVKQLPADAIRELEAELPRSPVERLPLTGAERAYLARRLIAKTPRLRIRARVRRPRAARGARRVAAARPRPSDDDPHLGRLARLLAVVRGWFA